MEDDEAPGAGNVGGRQEEEEGCDGFGAICDGVELSSPTWWACPGTPYPSGSKNHDRSVTRRTAWTFEEGLWRSAVDALRWLVRLFRT